MGCGKSAIKKEDKDYLSLSPKLRGVVDNIVDAMFQTFDKNNDGFIDREELKLCKEIWATQGANLQREPTEEELDNMMKVMDTNKDGKVDRSEMRAFYSKVMKLVEGLVDEDS